MIRNILLVAMREFRQTARTRSFWLTLLVLPLMFAAMPLISKITSPSFKQTVMLIDRSSTGAGAAITQRIDFDHQRDVLMALARFAGRNDLRDIAPDAAWTQALDWYPDPVVARFIAEGGAAPALTAIARKSPALADEFDMPEPDYAIMPVPDAVAQASFADLDAALAPQLAPGERRKPVDYILAIPADFGEQPGVRLWTNGQPRVSFMALLQSELTTKLRSGFLEAQGVAAPVAEMVNRLEPNIALTRPQQGEGRESVFIRSVLPMATAYLLLMSLIMSGNWMLQSTIEERSGKLIEAVLACVSPREFMHGKLLGTIAIGLVMVATWVSCALIAAVFTQGSIAEFIRPALEPLSSPRSVAAILFFFLTGYVMISLIFLVIGAMSDSMQDAQGFLVPTMLIIMLPFIILMQVILLGTDSIMVQVMTWIPLFTPFTVLARLGSGIPTWEIIGSGALLLAFIALEIMVLGRVFRASLLNGGGRPTLKTLMRRLRPERS